MCNLRSPIWKDAEEESSFVETVLGIPDDTRDPIANSHGLTLSQRLEWWRLVSEGMHVNKALMVVRGLL